MSKKILWLDDDTYFAKDLGKKLIEAGYFVTHAEELVKAERFLKDNKYDLLILDVMIPYKTKEAEKLYPPEETATGREAGLYFYRRMKDKLAENGTKVLVFTILVSHEIRKKFLDAGLKAENFSTKFQLRFGADFVKKVNKLLSGD